MLRTKTFILTILLLSVSSLAQSLWAQKATANATIEPHEILIGQQAIISVQAIAPKGRQIVFPIFNDSIVNGIEVLGMPKPDTLYNHEVMTITQKYVVTSFDSALYHVPFIPVIDGKDTIRTNDLGLKVITPALSEETNTYLEHLKNNPNDSIEFSKLGVKDIATVQTPPFVWQDYLMYIVLGILVLVLIVGVILAIYFYKKKKAKGYFFKPVVIKPPHVIALDALNHVKGEKLWQQGREKDYYTELTDILRQYIEDRYHVNVFEKTSDEILQIMHNMIETDSSVDSLEQILKLSDLVKFAKYKPFPNENDLSLVNAFLFVNQTKREITQDEQNRPDQTNNILKKASVNQNNDEDQDEDINWTISKEDMIDHDQKK